MLIFVVMYRTSCREGEIWIILMVTELVM